MTDKRNELDVVRSGEMTPRQKEILKATICKGASDDELDYFLEVCKLRQLNPFARQIYAIKRRNWNGATKSYDESIVHQTSIDGFRLIAERSGKYAGQLGPFFTADGEKWLDAWIEDTPPKACKVAILRHDFKEPLWAMARFNAYCPRNDKGEPTGLWRNMPDGQLAKCTEALGLRRAFPEELSGLYTTDEMQQAKQIEPIETVAALPEPSEPLELPTEGFLKEYPAIKQRISDHFTRLHINKSTARELYPNWPDNPDDIPMADLPKVAEAFGMELTLP